MNETRDWHSNRDMWLRVLKGQTGQGLDHWNERIQGESFADEAALRSWLAAQGITGYAATLLVMERFGYPDFVTASATELLESQYADRPQLRPIYDAVIAIVAGFGPFTIQMRKSYVSLLTPRRTFARIRPSTKTRLDVGLRLEGQRPDGRLLPCKLQETMQVQLSLTTIAELDNEALDWLKKAYLENS